METIVFFVLILIAIWLVFQLLPLIIGFLLLVGVTVAAVLVGILRVVVELVEPVLNWRRRRQADKRRKKWEAERIRETQARNS